jgi:hypothetical protein
MDGWQQQLARELLAAGFQIDSAKTALSRCLKIEVPLTSTLGFLGPEIRQLQGA